MPIHEYMCLNCKETNEFLTGMGSKDDILVCKNCGGRAFKKLMSASNFNMNPGGGGDAGASRCCGADDLRDDCTPGMCCGSAIEE